MERSVSGYLLFRALYEPEVTCRALAESEPSSWDVFSRYSIWLLFLPPLFSWIGAYNFGWRLGADSPLFLSPATLTLVSAGYFLTLLFGFYTTALVSRWMASTYGASDDFGRHVALITIVGQPMAIASVAHLYPDVFVNLLVMIPTLIWSIYLLYTGIPQVLETPPERGMLMASALVAWLLVAAVSLLGLTMGLWTAGFGPALGV